MIQTVHDFAYTSRDDHKTDLVNKRMGCHRQVDVYRNRENRNWIITKKNRIEIILEFLTDEDISMEKIRECWWKLENGGILNFKKDMTLGGIAAQARKDKVTQDFQADERKFLTDADQYESHGKRNVMLGG